MLKSLALIFSIIGLTCVVTVKCKKDSKDSRQAIPLALVQADTLASAKHPPNTDKANGTTNGTALANNNTNNNTILHKLINLYNPSVSANIPQAVWRVDHQTNSNYGVENEAIVGNDNSGTTNDDDPFKEFTRCNHSQEILVGPLNSLPEHPNGNGPQDMKLKATGINKRDIESTKNQNPSSKTIKRFKREFEIDDDDDDDDLGGNDKAETIIVRLKDDRNQHERSRRSKTSKKSLKSKKSSKRDGIGLPYVPNRERFMPPGASRLPYDEEEIMEDEMSQIPSSQPVGMASSPEPSNYGPYEDAPRTANEPAQEFESPAPDPLRLQESYERSSTWEPIGAQARFSQQEEYNDGLPDRNYDRTLESDAQSLDDRMVQNFFNREKGRQGYDQSYDQQDPNKRSEEEKYSLLDSLGIGESEIDHKYLSEAKSIQDYLTKSEIRSVGQSLGHNTRQHNNIQVGSSPEMMQERPNFWNMIDSASYTPMSNEAETLMPNEQRDNDGQVLQSQNSMGRVFVPLNMENLAQNVQNEISKHYKLPNRMQQNGMMDPDKAVPNYPNIVKSFYPNIPYQTVSGASLNPPDINSPNYRSFIQQPYAQQQQQLYPQQFMQTPQAPFQPVPLMLPFAGMPNPQYQNMLGNRQPFMGPMQMPAMGRSFPMGMTSDMPGNNQDAEFPGHETRSFEEEAKPKGPGMLTVSSSDNGDDVSQQQSKASDFEELIPTATHNSIQKGNVENRPMNDTLMYRREKVEADLASMKTAIKEVLDSAIMAGNITSDQSKAITDELTGALAAKEKNKTTTTNVTSTAQDEAPNKRVIEELKTMKSKVAHVLEKCSDTINDCKRFKDAGICPFVATFMNGACAKTCNTCDTKGKSRIQELLEPKKDPLVDFKEKNGPSMYLDFENATSANIITDKSGHENDAVLLKGAKLSSRKLGTCGKGAELNQGEISWDGKTFHGKPVNAVTLAMWVKVHKGGTINWFASGDQGTTFYTSTKDAIVPSKIWTHVTGTYDSANGMSSIFINGVLIKQTKQKKGQKLVQDWLVNGIGQSFGDDSMHYVDEVYIFNRALKAFEVKALYDKCSFNRMVIHYGFQKGNNSLILDQSGLQNDAIPIAGAAQKDDCDRCGACLDLTHGLNPTLKIERISLSHIPTRAVSIALWVSMNSTKGAHDVFITQGPLDGSGYRLRIIDGKIRWSVGTDNGETIFDLETKSVTIPETLWTHIIVAYDKESGRVSIFVNGVSKLDETVDQKQRKLLPRDWETEAKLGDKSFDGFMDEFIMYNWAIDSSEAMYVRKYCADHPKLVRFIVHVPLTKRNKVMKVEETKSNGTEIHKKDG